MFSMTAYTSSDILRAFKSFYRIGISAFIAEPEAPAPHLPF